MGNAPPLLFIKLVSHAFRELFELALRLGAVCIDHEVLKMPESPTQILKALTLFKISCDLGTNLIGVRDYGTSKTKANLPCLG